MNRDAAIEAGARALRATSLGGTHGVTLAEYNDHALWRVRAAAVIDAAAPHLAGEPVGWAVVFDQHEPTFEGVVYLNRDDFDRDYPGDFPGARRCALVPVEEDQP